MSLSVFSRYFMALVQEMAVKIDQGFLGAILALFTPAADPKTDSEKVELLLTCEKCQQEPHTEGSCV